MVPVSTILIDLELVLVHAIGRDAVEAQARHTIHVRGQNDAVPVNRGVFGQAVFHTQCDGIAFPPAQNWPWNGPINSHRGPGCSGNVHWRFTNE